MADDNKPHLHVEFFIDAVENPAMSREAGRPIFEDKEFVKVMIAGDPKNTLIAPAQERGSGGRTYAERFPEHYKLFKADLDQLAASGTPLTEVPWLTAARREELKALKIFTVEGLAGLDGQMLQRIGMGARDLKNQAQAWLDKAAGSASDAKMASELAARDAEIEALKSQMADMMASFGKFDPDGDGKPGGAVNVSQENGPFAGYDDGALRAFIEDRSGKKPHHLAGRAKLVKMAEEILEAEQAEAEAA